MSLPIAQTVSLEVLREVPMGMILGGADGEVLLPSRSVPSGTRPGDRLEVFLYTDSEDRPIATTAEPIVEADQFARLRVASVGRAGAFLDWGLPKDLLLPHSEQLCRVRPDQHVVVYVYCDAISQRPVATMKIDRQLSVPPEDLREGQSVDLLLYEATDLGIKAVVDGDFGGLLYHDAANAAPDSLVGSQRRGFIQRIRSDGKVDLTLVPTGRAGADRAEASVLEALRRSGGRLDLGDKSDPEEIRRRLDLSKKAFKRAIGGLYRQRKIRIEPHRLVLLEDGADVQNE